MRNRDSPISYGHEQQDNNLHEDDFDESLFSQQRRQQFFQGECSFPSNGQSVSVSATGGLRPLTPLSQMEMGNSNGKSSLSDLAGFNHTLRSLTLARFTDRAGSIISGQKSPSFVH